MASGTITKDHYKMMTKEQTGTVSLGANTNAAVSITPTAYAGYYCLGIIGIRNSHGASVVLTEFSSTLSRAVIRNITSTAYTVTLTFELLYISNDLI